MTRPGEVVLLDLAGRDIGHVAILRDPSRPTPETADPVQPTLTPFEELRRAEPEPAETSAGPTLEPADIELALRYLPDYRVLVVADPLPPAALDVVLAASRWSGAALVIVLAHGADPSTSRTPPSSRPPRATPTTRSRRSSEATRRRSIGARSRPKRSPPRRRPAAGRPPRD